MNLSEQYTSEEVEKGWRDHWNRKYKIYQSYLKSGNLFPTIFQIQTITSCNGKCIMCPYTYKQENKTHYMDDKLFEKIIKEITEGQKLINKRIMIVLMLQNEPFLDKNLINRIKFIKQSGNFYVSTTTNGSLLDREKIRGLEKSGIDSLTISIDSLNKKVFEEIRPGLDFGKIMQNLELLRNSNLKDKIILQMIFQRRNQLERGKFIQLRKEGIKTRVFWATNRCGELKNFEDIKMDDSESTERLERFYKEYNKIRVNKGDDSVTKGICYFPFFRFSILSNGDVIICCHDWKHDHIMGNVQKNTIKEVWNSRFKECRQLFLAGRGDEIDSCRKCSLMELAKPQVNLQ